MAAHIPFVKNKGDLSIYQSLYADSELVRLPIRSCDELGKAFKEINSLWVDLEFEGFLALPSQREDKWEAFMEEFPGGSQLLKRKSLESPKGIETDEIVSGLLNRAMRHKPEFITVPQIPYNNEFNVSRINRKLANSAGKWRRENGRKVKFILPIIVTHQDLTKNKTARNKIVGTAQAVYENSDSTGFWVVDSSLSDQLGTGNFREVRFRSLIEFSNELNSKISAQLSVAGPYWGLNVLLWSRELVTNPAISLGNSYTYYLAGFKGHSPPKTRIALPPLLRWAIASSELKKWLEESLGVMAPDSPEAAEFRNLVSRFESFSTNKTTARRQIARFYKEWLDRIESISPGGRSLALFQEFSSAYVLGRSLKNLPANEKTARKPAIVAEQFMANCL